MTNLEKYGVIAYLAKNSPSKWIGRTALMKFCYLLQSVRGVPLGYHFTLYSYGPFDSAVLSDLGVTEALGLVESTFQDYPSGYGYRIECTASSEDVVGVGGDLLARHKQDVEWVLETFGSRGAADLELLATLVYVDHESARRNSSLSLKELAKKVSEVKPRFADKDILAAAEKLKSQGLLSGTLGSEQ